MLPTLENNAVAGYQGSVKIELLKGAGLLVLFAVDVVAVFGPYLLTSYDRQCHTHLQPCSQVFHLPTPEEMKEPGDEVEPLTLSVALSDWKHSY